jgi:hypothetical protein
MRRSFPWAENKFLLGKINSYLDLVGRALVWAKSNEDRSSRAVFFGRDGAPRRPVITAR